MKNLKQLFEKFHAKFQHKKDFFKKRIERLRAKGKIEAYKQQSDLFLELEKSDRELQNNFLLSSEKVQSDKQILRTKIKAFKTNYQMLNEVTKPLWRQWSEAIIIAVVLAFVIRTVIFGLYCVPSGSAEPTILVGDHIWGNKFIYFFQKPKRGEFVIFDNPTFELNKSSKFKVLWQKYVGLSIPFLGLESGPENVVKRLIAIPGDTIEGRVEDDKPVIYLNGKKLDEPYVNPYPLIKVRRTRGFIDADHFGPFRIPEFLGLKYMIDPHFPVCTYDPSKSLSDQPFYKLTQEDVVKDLATGMPMVIPPYSPTQADIFGPITIPDGKYWLMGDSRNNSYDSRYWGLLDESAIHGRASFVILSIDTSEAFWFYDLMKHPIDFWTKHIRWNCFFKGLGKYYGRPDLAN
jgi:signal peptidase I